MPLFRIGERKISLFIECFEAELPEVVVCIPFFGKGEKNGRQ